MIEIHSQDDFDRMLQSSGISVCMFSAFWCPDCMYIKPFMPKIEEKFSDLTFYMINRDECMDITLKYDIMGIPSFICFKDGKEISRFVSALRKSKEEIENYLEKTIESEQKIC